MLNNAARVIAKAVGVLGICAIAVGVVMRIAWINDTALKLPAVETHEMHENVSFDGAFLSLASENTSGYSVNVTNAEKMSYNEYIERYGLDKSKTFEGLDSLSLICLEIEVGNIGNSDGGIFLFECNLVPERKNTYYIADTWLWAESEPAITDGSMRYIKIAPDSTYTIHVPYKTNIRDEEEQTEYKRVIEDSEFNLYLSNMPIRKEIHVIAERVANTAVIESLFSQMLLSCRLIAGSLPCGSYSSPVKGFLVFCAEPVKCHEHCLGSHRFICAALLCVFWLVMKPNGLPTFGYGW